MYTNYYYSSNVLKGAPVVSCECTGATKIPQSSPDPNNQSCSETCETTTAPVYTGMISLTPQSDDSINSDSHYYDNSLCFLTAPISWSSSVPASIKNLLLCDFLKSKIYTLNFCLQATVTGQHFYQCSDGTKVTIAPYQTPYNSAISAEQKIYENIHGGSHDGTDNINGTCRWNNINWIPDSYFLHSKNHSTSCDEHDTDHLYVTWTLYIYVTELCNTAQSMGSNVNCEQYCWSGGVANPACFTEVEEYCIDDGNYVNSGWCLNYLDALVANTANADQASAFSDHLTDWCTTNYNIQNGTIGKVLNPPQTKAESTTQQLCACHLQDQFYTTFEDELEQQVANLSSLGLDDHCLFADCADSKYQRYGRQCTGPQCIQVVDFTNNGEIDGEVTINQNIQGCNQLSPKTSPSPDPPSPDPPSPAPPSPAPPGPSPSPTRTGLIVIAVTAVVVLLLLLLLVFIF